MGGMGMGAGMSMGMSVGATASASGQAQGRFGGSREAPSPTILLQDKNGNLLEDTLPGVLAAITAAHDQAATGAREVTFTLTVKDSLKCVL